MSYRYLERLEETVREHEKWRVGECLNLEPAENHSSPHVRSMYLSDLGNRYSDPEKFHKGTRFIDELVSLTEEVARKVFNARYADVRPLSGNTADLAVMLALTKKGDKVLSVAPDDGGYPGISHAGLGRVLELENLYFPYDDAAVNIDAKASKRLMRTHRPTLVFFGSSFIPFPHPTRELSGLREGGVHVYDGSHVLGLFAGGEFQDPLREGCSLLVGSTHKSLPGPQGGIIVGNNDEVFKKVSAAVYPGIVDNIHLNRVAALAISLLEMLEHGKAYARATVENSKALARSLADRGVKLRGESLGYSKSHQVLLDYDQAKLKFFASRLESANIIADDGGRLGTSEVTRMGYGPHEMEEVAELVSLVILGKQPADIIKRRVRGLVKQFQEPKYVLRSVPKPLE